GISFYTFQGMSYIIDVYRKEGTLLPDGSRACIVQKDPLKLGLYISMFPQLIAGPIVRYEDVRESLGARKKDAARFAGGIERFAIGLAKKAILANMVGALAESVFAGDYSHMSQSVAWLGAVAYTLQIYFDFSGYSDMAIGLGRIFGFHFQENFNYPYISSSIREFWRRWHMSLSGWFRDYLYIPLGGSRSGNVYLHLLLVFATTGIWHGAGWGFLVWGLWHGFFVIAERWWSRHKKSGGEPGLLVRCLSHVYTMLVVMVGWVIFRIVDLPKTLAYLSVMFGWRRNAFTAFDIRFYLSRQNLFFLLLSVICCLPIGGVLKKRIGEPSRLLLYVRRAALLVLLLLSFLFIINSSYNPFIYFRF
ncbi:MAG: MBOAT family protein, partial [Lachnospiraceae bacterium]|nr:MBOAT family protein [Lachnospiraceae bacterium]